MIDFFARLFDTGDFPARWACGQWQPAHGWLHIGSDIAISLAYFAIPLSLLAFILRRRDAPFLPIFWLFGVFIAACGTGHLLEAIIFWQPVYRFAAVVKAVTAVASWATVIALIANMPAALSLRSPRQLEAEVAERTRELKREKATLEAILARLSVGVLVADASGRTILLNEAGRALLGLEDGAEVKEAIAALRDRSGDELAAEELPIAEALAGVEVDKEMVIRAPEPAPERIVAVAARSVKSEFGEERAVLVIKDLTETRASERRLRQANTRLKEANRKLKTSNRDLEEFAHIASHDLREPLRMVSSYAELLRKRYQGQLDERADRYIQYTVEGAQRMRQLIEDLLAFSQVQSRELSFEDFDLEEPYRKALENLRASLRESKAELECGPLPRVSGEPDQLRQVFQNLIGNAIKYAGAEAPKITIAAERREDRWLISVRDRGIGFPQAQARRIFQIFRRLHGRDLYSGSGIGLAIVKRAVERHGGEVWAESEPEEGAVFSFTLRPAAAEGSGASPVLERGP